MPYKPLHHKYRPQSLSELVGQAPIATTLTNALTDNRLAPAYLFSGPKGTGKTSTARILAKSLNCLASSTPTPNPCHQCDSCTAIALGNSLDVTELDAASNNGVEQMRDIIEKAQFAPVNSRFKVYIIDECHALSSSATQALLKILEEPGARVVFILCTTEPSKLGETIISRCQRLNFRPIAPDALAAHLRAIALSERIDITDDAIELIVHHSNGGLRDAQILLDQVRLLADTVTYQVICDLLGTIPEQDLWELFKAIAFGSPETVLSQIRAIFETGKEPLTVLGNLLEFYTNAVLARSLGGTPTLGSVSTDTWQLLEGLPLDFPTLLWQQQHLRACESQIKFSRQPRLMLEVALFGLLARPPESLPAIAPPQPQEKAPLGQHLSSVWAEVINCQSPTLKALLSQHAQLISFDGRTAQIQVASAALKPKVAASLNLITLVYSICLGRDRARRFWVRRRL